MLKISAVRISTCAGVLLLSVVFSSFAAGSRHFVHGHIPAAVARLKAVGTLPGTDQMQLAINLPARNEAALDELVKEIYNPASANYHRYLTPKQFAERFGPTVSDYQAVIDFAKKNGLTVTGTHASRLVLDVAGSVTDIERTFQVKLRLYDHPMEKRKFYAPDVEPSVDASLSAPILGISGLDDYSLVHPASLRLAPVDSTSGQTPNAGSGPGSTFIGKDFRLAYVPGTTLTGAGQSIALLQFDGYYPSDIAAYLTLANLSAVTLSNVPVPPSYLIGTPGGNNIEVALDIEMAISMAPGLSKIYVYQAAQGTPWPTILGQIADDNLASQVSCSWGGGSANPNYGAETIFKQMALQGQSFFSASGDDDAFVGSVTFPSDSTNITQVGGTTLTTASQGGARLSETVWNKNNGTGTGGGISTIFPIPTWQQGINSFLTNGGSTAFRNSPDVALTADNVYVKYNNGQGNTVTGTSCAAPLWAGFMALVNQQAAISGKPAVGFINPVIYEIANESIYSSTFNDITTGNNISTASPNRFYAVPGYDLCTGIGTPKGTNLINALVSPDPLIVTPNFGFSASVTPAVSFNVSSQTFYLTNSGTSSLVWSLINTSSWLGASSIGGTLAAGSGDSVVVSLNMAASNLNTGTYMANLWFSNDTSGVAHSRFFTLAVGIVQNGGFETGDFTGWTLTGNGAFGGSIYNGVVGVDSLDDGSGPDFIHSGSYGAFLGDTNLATLSQSFQTAPGRNYLLSFWLVNSISGSGQQFIVNWNTNSSSINRIYNRSNPPAMSWTNITFVLQAKDTNTTLQFVAKNPPNGFGLDDITVTPVFPPAFTVQPTNLTVVAGGTAVFNASVDSALPVKYRWRKNGLDLGNGFGISGTTTNSLTLTSVTSSSAGDYALFVTNAYGSATSSVATLIILSFPVVSTALTNQTIQCGDNVTFAVNISGGSPLSYQWSLDDVLVPDVTGNSLVLTNVHLPSHTVSVIVTNVYGSVTNNALLTVADTLGPVITLNGANPVYVELGGVFSDPGATANDACAGPVAVTVSGTVNSNVVGTNLLTYTAGDGNGNTNSVTRAVIVQNNNVTPTITSELVNPDGTFTLNFAGTPGGTYILETTTNILAATFWQSIVTNTFGTNGVSQFKDFDSTNFALRFYRLKTAQ